MMIEIRNLANTSIDEIHAAFLNAFSDYSEPKDYSVQQLQYTLQRRGCDLNLSFGAFDGGQLVGFILNGLGTWNGELTAYDTGTGVVKEYRNRGIATAILNWVTPVLKKNNVTQYLLEVIRSNIKAYDLYKKAGFKVIRELDYYLLSKEKIKINTASLPDNFTTRTIDSPDWELFRTFWDFTPSWQNSVDAVCRKMSYFKIIGVFDSETLVAYGIIETHTGDLPQIAVAIPYRGQGIGRYLFQQLIASTQSPEIKIINSDASCVPFKMLMQTMNLFPGAGQYEMLLHL